MNARPNIPPEDRVTIEVDGVALMARRGQTVIEATDEAGIYIPRFCYHKKLSVAANCRMCLVQVEKSPKPMPACATPVMEGMRIFTKSDYTKDSQRAVMEFLLINHPLDCPICDQGGECELQDLALGYGRSVSRFTEKKRVVKDKDIGPLIATEMTRCIHCTRCVRFLEEIAGHRELGGVGRGENTEIGTFVGRAVESELSGNVIDLCPVGALTSKPFRFAARAWELTQHASVAPHDSVGSNLFLHVRRGELLRVVPRENESINEVWLADRDRFSYQGVNGGERLQIPMIKAAGTWTEVDWETALEAAAGGLREVLDTHGPEQLGMLVSPAATVEEMYLAARLAENLGCGNVDHRLRQGDFSDQERAPLFPWLGQSIADLEQLDAALLIGSNVRKDLPIIAHRLRKASLKGAKLMFINPVDYEFHFTVAAKAIVCPSRMIGELAAVAAAVLGSKDVEISVALRDLLDAAQPNETHEAMARTLLHGKCATVLLGSGASAHPAFSTLRALAALIAEHSGAVFGYLPEAAGSVGGWLAGTLPHRQAGGMPRAACGLSARAMLEQPRKGYLLLGVEPEYDCWDAHRARWAVEGAEFVVALTSFMSEAARAYADVLLPVGSLGETSGTFVNLEGLWQSFSGASQPLGAARPGWKVLRVLGNRLGCRGFDYVSSEQVRDELRDRVGAGAGENRLEPGPVAQISADGLERVGDVPIYALDPLVRRAAALQATGAGADATVRICRAQAQRLGIADAEQVSVRQGEGSAILPLVIDERVAEGAAWIPAGLASSTMLGPAFGTVELRGA